MMHEEATNVSYCMGTYITTIPFTKLKRMWDNFTQIPYTPFG